VTSLIQPLDQGVLETMKRNYRRQLLKHLLADLENGKSVVESLKKINIKDVIY
jgi:type II secretory pathway component PulF